MAARPTAATAVPPRAETQQVSAEVKAAIAIGLAQAAGVATYAEALKAAGYGLDRLRRALEALLLPLLRIRFDLLYRRIEQQWNDVLFDTARPRADVISAILREEAEYERLFALRSAGRLGRHMALAARDGKDLDEALRRALAREARFERMRQQAVGRRITLRLEEEWVRDQSPEGAYWILDPSKRMHTPDCVAMANRAWTWRVLAVVRPSNRHNLCGCRLLPLPMARANSLANTGVVQDVPPRVASQPHR